MVDFKGFSDVVGECAARVFDYFGAAEDVDMSKRSQREIARAEEARERASAAVPPCHEALPIGLGKQVADAGSVIPPCPSCHRIDRVQRDTQTANGVALFACARCRTLYPAPPRR